MTLFHERWRRRVSLLAAGVLEGAEREATLHHLDACAGCREEQAAVENVLRLVAADPLHREAPTLPVSALIARVEARLDAGPQAQPAQPALNWRPVLVPLAAAAAVVLGVTATLFRTELPGAGGGPIPPTVAVAPSRFDSEQIEVSDDVLRRLERNLAREQTARYLNEAQDLLVTVAASLPICDRAAHRVDVSDEARRSRELLARRSLVDLGSDDVASVRPVLQDVEQVLREVAALDPCVRPADLTAIQREMEQSRLLMKIDLMTRELLG